MIRTLFAGIASLVALGCLAYAFWLTQYDWPAERKSRLAPEISVMAFALTGGLCLLSAAVVLGNRREGQ